MTLTGLIRVSPDNVPADHRAKFLACLYFTVLVDQAMHTFCYRDAHRFEELTRYPKFRVGLGHPAHLDPARLLTEPIWLQLADEGAVREIIPDAMTLFVQETASFFREHMPEIHAPTFFNSLLADFGVTGDYRGAFSAVAEGELLAEPISLHELIVRELSRAVFEVL